MCTALLFLANKLCCANMTTVNVINQNLQQQKCSNVQ